MTRTTSHVVDVPRRSLLERAILWSEALLATTAYLGAIGLISGRLDLGRAVGLLPLGSVLLAGLALAVVNGLIPTVVLLAALRGHRWAEVGHLVVGLALVTWLLVQVAVLGPPFSPLQGIYLAWGWIIAALAVRLAERRRKTEGRSP